MNASATYLNLFIFVKTTGLFEIFYDILKSSRLWRWSLFSRMDVKILLGKAASKPIKNKLYAVVLKMQLYTEMQSVCGNCLPF